MGLGEYNVMIYPFSHYLLTVLAETYMIFFSCAVAMIFVDIVRDEFISAENTSLSKAIKSIACIIPFLYIVIGIVLKMISTI